MGIFDQELILPGVITEIIPSYSSNYDTSKWGTTDSVCIIGTAFNGPTGKPVKIYSPEYAEYVFGSTFDSLSRKEATLVAEIKNCWDRGCRTIYAIRISGKDMYKDYNLASNVNCRLRVSSKFASNGYKKCFFEYDPVDTAIEMATGETSKVRIYKPADKATIMEKYTGKVAKSNSILINEIELMNNLNITKSSRLSDFISAFNSYSYNNVLYLSLVDLDGNDITDTEMAQCLSFEEMLPGIYFIGRDENVPDLVKATKVKEVMINDSNKEEFQNFYGNAVKQLSYNTDITQPYPIYHTDVTALNKLIGGVKEITMTKLFDFLKTPGLVDYLWPANSIDYEEVSLTDFDMYRRLGCGFANTAKIVETREGSGIYKVVEVTSETDENRIYAIEDGIYSVLQNLPADYRVLTGKNADTSIKGKLPKRAEFQKRMPTTFTIFSQALSVAPIIDTENVTELKDAYKFELHTLGDESLLSDKDDVMNNLVSSDAAVYVTELVNPVDESTNIKSELKDGELFQNGGVIYIAEAGKLVKITNQSWFKDEYKGSLFLSGDKLYTLSAETGADMSLKEYGTASSETVAEDEEATSATNEQSDIEGKYLVTVIDDEETICKVVNGKVEYVTTLEQFDEEDDSCMVSIKKAVDNVVIPSEVEGAEATQELHVIKTVIIRADLNNTLSQLAISLNENTKLSKMFEFEVGPNMPIDIKMGLVLADGDEDALFNNPAEGSDLVDTSVLKAQIEGVEGQAEDSHLDSGKVVYDTSLYIPYKTSDNFARQLAQHCIYTSLKTKPTHGFIGVSKLVNAGLKSIEDRVDKLVGLDLDLYAKKNNGNYMLNKDNTPYDIGRAISVTCFQNKVDTGDNYTYISNGASAYAGMVSCLDLEQSSTSQAINVDDIGYEFTNYQLGRLTQAGFVTVKNSYTKGYVVTDGVTKAIANSSFTRLAVSRIVNAIDDAIRSVAEPYIGKPNCSANKNSLEAAIKSILDNMMEKLIQRYSFKITSDQSLEKLGVIKIDYEILPVYEIRDIKNNITIKEE